MSRNQRRNKRNRAAGSRNANQAGNRGSTASSSVTAARPRSSTETKSSLKTTELIAYAAAVLAVILTALAIDEDRQGGGDPFGAEAAIRYITYLTIGYMIARGLAKSGSHENHVDHATDLDDDNAVRTVVVDDEDIREGDEAAEPASAAETAEPAVVPSDEVHRGAADDVDAKP